MRRFCILMLFAWLAQFASAQDGLVLSRETDSASLSPHISILRDQTHSMTLEDARAAFAAGRFAKNTQAWPRFGFTRDTIWVRFALESSDADRMQWLMELRTARMDELDWALVRNDGAIEHLTAGNLQTHSLEMLDNIFPVFPFTLAADETIEVYLRIYSEASVHLPMKIWAPLAYAGAQSRNEAVFALFFGYMTALILLSFILSIFTQDRGFVIYSFSLIGLIANYFICSGYYAWFHFPAVRFAVHGGTIVSSEITLILLLVYLRYFFNMRVETPTFDRRVIRPLFWATVVFATCAVVGPFRAMVQLLQFQSLLLGAFSMLVALLFWWRGNRVARFYFLGWIAFWALFVWSVLQFRGLVPIPALPEYPAIISIAISMTLFFFALADRVTQMRREAVAMQNAAGEELQKQVSARTEQLQQQAQLILDLHDGIGGITANIGLMASLAGCSAEDKKEELLSGIAELATEGSAEIRSLMNTLESHDMFWPDLVVECRRYSEMMLSAHGITFSIIVEGDASMPGPGMMHGMSLFRIFKEAVANIVKHSDAKRVEVRMHFDLSMFRMVISDNGKGLDGNTPSGRGLKNMRARISNMGGDMSESGEQGTTLTFELPLPIKSPERGI